MGTPYYLAPELINNDRNKRFQMEELFAADIFSLGVVILEIFTCNLTFKKQSANNVQTSRLGNIKNSSIAPLVQKCISVDPKKRPALDQILEEIKKL